jgi:hypothetical protein
MYSAPIRHSSIATDVRERLALSYACAFIDLGEIIFTGNFTLNHLYDFNNPASQPFGQFSLQTVSSVSGLFSPYVHVGDTLVMSTQFLFGPINPTSQEPSLPIVWSIGGFTIVEQSISITGADSGRLVSGSTILSGNGFNYSDYPPFGAFSRWGFIAPPYDISNFPEDITGPISFGFGVGYDNGIVVPDAGSTNLMFGLAILILFYGRRIHCRSHR